MARSFCASSPWGCRGDGGEPCGGAADGCGGSARGRGRLRLLSSKGGHERQRARVSRDWRAQRARRRGGQLWGGTVSTPELDRVRGSRSLTALRRSLSAPKMSRCGHLAGTRSSRPTPPSSSIGLARLTSGSDEFQGHRRRRGTPWRGPQSDQRAPRSRGNESRRTRAEPSLA